MKKLLCTLLAMMLLCCSASAMAGDVSAFEEHASIDLTPFKDDFYSVTTLDDMSYEATINAPQFKIKTTYTAESGKTYEHEFTIFLRIKMNALMGVEFFTPEVGFYTSDFTSLGGFRIVMGENRYLVAAEVTSSSSYGCSGKILFSGALLKEMVTTEFPVKLCAAGTTAYVHEFTAEELEIFRHFVNDLEAVGLLDSLTDDNVITITNWN